MTPARPIPTAPIVSEAPRQISILHTEGYIESDIKPENILVTEEGARAQSEVDQKMKTMTNGSDAYMLKKDNNGDYLFEFGRLSSVT